jgi:hypothetical protein
MRQALPVWRSLLYVPAHAEGFVAKAHEQQPLSLAVRDIVIGALDPSAARSRRRRDRPMRAGDRAPRQHLGRAAAPSGARPMRSSAQGSFCGDSRTRPPRCNAFTTKQNAHVYLLAA